LRGEEASVKVRGLVSALTIEMGFGWFVHHLEIDNYKMSGTVVQSCLTVSSGQTQDPIDCFEKPVDYNTFFWFINREKEFLLLNNYHC
jgi:hypothetical protein